MVNRLLSFVKQNLWLSIIAGVLMLFVFFGKQMKKLFGGTRRRRRRAPVRRARIVTRRRKTRSGKPVVRSVGTRRRTGQGYPAAGGGTIPYKYNKDGTIKKAWQVSGTVAARRRMAGLRKKR